MSTEQFTNLTAHAFRLSNRWLLLNVSVARIGLLYEVFDPVSVQIPASFNLGITNAKGRIIKKSVNPQTLVTQLIIETSIRVGTTVEDPDYWKSPTCL